MGASFVVRRWDLARVQPIDEPSTHLSLAKRKVNPIPPVALASELVFQLELHSIFSGLTKLRGQGDHCTARSLATFAWNAEGFSEYVQTVILIVMWDFVSIGTTGNVH